MEGIGMVAWILLIVADSASPFLLVEFKNSGDNDGIVFSGLIVIEEW